MITPDSERTLNTTLAVNSQYNESDIDAELIAASEWLFIEGYKLTDDGGAAAVEKALYYAKKHDTRVAVSCSDKFIIDVFGDRLRSVLKSTDLVICNEAEGTALAQEEDWTQAHKALKSTSTTLCSREANMVRTCSGTAKKHRSQRTRSPLLMPPVLATCMPEHFLYGVLERSFT